MTRHVSGTAARQALLGHLAEVQAETGRFVLVTGPVLSGKTTLINDFARTSQIRGVRVLSATCSRFSRSEPLGVPRQLLRDRRRTTSREHPADASGTFSVAQAVETAVGDILRLAAGRLLIVCVDDVRHADPASARFVEALAASIRHHPVLLVVTDRTDASHSSIRLRRLIEERGEGRGQGRGGEEHAGRGGRGGAQGGGGHVRRLEVAPLSTSDVAELARTEFSLRCADRFAERLRRLTGGSALLTKALLRDHATRCGCRGELEGIRTPVIGPAYRQAVLDCLHRLDPDTRDIAEALAMADGFSALEVIAELTRLDLRVVEESTQELSACGLLRSGEFRHPAIREVILGDMPRGRRSELSTRTATVLRAAGAPMEHVARWLSAMDDTGRAGTRAPRALPRADWGAAGHGNDGGGVGRPTLNGTLVASPATGGTVSGQELGQELGQEPEQERAEGRVPSQRRHPEAGPPFSGALSGGPSPAGPSPSDALPSDALPSDPPPSEASPCISPTTLGLPGSGPPGMQEDHHSLWLAKDELALLDRRVAAIGRRESPEHLALVARRLLLACDFPALLREVGRKEQLTRRTLEERLTRSPHYAAAWALSSALTEGGPDGQDVMRAAKRALYGCDATDENLHAIMAALAVVVRHDNPGQASFWFERFARATDGRLACRQARLRVVRAEIALRGGDPATAATEAEQALGLLPARLWGIRMAEPLACAILAHVAAGNSAAAAVLLSHNVPDSLFDTRYGLDYLYARGLYRLVAGESLAGLADFLRCGGLMGGWGMDRHSLIPWRLAAAAAYVTMNEYGKAVDLIDETLDRIHAEALRGGTKWGDLHARTRTPGDRAKFGERVFEELRESAGTPGLFALLESFRTGEAAKQKKPEVARYKIYDRHSSFLEKLSPSEQRVAVLAAKGSTNQQIAHDLSITVSTVEQHLTRIYRKLQLGGRSELRAKLG
ncbi:AAA family ATPase [Streptomyces sp. NPDC053048]|uniref:AAA family ATPase n=1 Tax=Streptomyces sp. NPDC053048 TaxID=3365694 RepID=UPI0037D1D793